MVSVHKADYLLMILHMFMVSLFHNFRAALENDSHGGFMFPVLSQQR